jgi:hypothetical protein
MTGLFGLKSIVGETCSIEKNGRMRQFCTHLDGVAQMRKERSVQYDVVLAPYRCAGPDYVMVEHSCHVPIQSSWGSIPPPSADHSSAI